MNLSIERSDSGPGEGGRRVGFAAFAQHVTSLSSPSSSSSSLDDHDCPEEIEDGSPYERRMELTPPGEDAKSSSSQEEIVIVTGGRSGGEQRRLTSR